MATNQVQAAIGTPEWFVEINQILDTLGAAQQVDSAVAAIAPTVEVETGPPQPSTNVKTDLPNTTQLNATTLTGKESPNTNDRCLRRCMPCVNPPTQAPPSKRKRPNPKKRSTNVKTPEVTNEPTVTLTQPNQVNLLQNEPYLCLSLGDQTTTQMVTTLIPISAPNGFLPLASGVSTLASANIDPLPFLSEVYDTIFAPCIPGTCEIEKKIRSAVMKKLLLDSSVNALSSAALHDIEDVIQFIINRFREISYLPN